MCFSIYGLPTQSSQDLSIFWQFFKDTARRWGLELILKHSNLCTNLSLRSGMPLILFWVSLKLLPWWNEKITWLYSSIWLIDQWNFVLYRNPCDQNKARNTILQTLLTELNDLGFPSVGYEALLLNKRNMYLLVKADKKENFKPLELSNLLVCVNHAYFKLVFIDPPI